MIVGRTVAAGARRSVSTKHIFLTTTSAAALLVASAFAGIDPARAQSAQPSQTAQSNQTAQSPQVEEIVVTGSLIIRNGYQAPTPLTVMNVEEMQQENTINFSDFADKVPTLAGSYNSHNGGINSSDGNPGTNSLSLRGLGANRTLVLLDGVRVTANNTTGLNANGGSVDINDIPDALIQRMDIVTGGATATYGSGALVGVVNVILDTGFTGVKGSVEGGVTTYGDDRQYELSLTAGTGFAGDRGHFVISGEDHYSAGIPNAQSARSWMANDAYTVTNPAYTATNGQPFYLVVPNAQSANYAPGGVITSGPLKGITFAPGGAPMPFLYGSPTDGSTMEGGQTGAAGALNSGFSVDSSLDIPISRQNLFGRIDYDVADNVQIYLQYDWAYTSTQANGRGNYTSLTIASGNPYIPAAIQAQMTSLKVTSFALGIYNDGLGILGSDADRHFDMYLGGVKGKFDAFGTNWSWDVWATQSTARTSIWGHNVFNKADMTLAADAVQGPNGSIVCRSTLTSPSNGCVPFDPFGGGASQASINYLEPGPRGDVMDLDVRLFQGAGVVRGEPFSTWAGPVSVAVGGEWDRNSSAGIGDPISVAGGYSSADYTPTTGHYETTEGFAEVDIPLAKDTAWAKSFDLNAGLRETNFSTSGTVTTWKVGATYAPIDDLHFRATYSRDTRAPNLGELYSQGTFVNGFVTNPFQANKTVPDFTITTGNPTLSPEKANTTGLGAVYQPSWFQGFSSSFDFYNINIGPSITTAGAQATINDCYNGIQALCANVPVDSSGNLFNVYLRPVNAAGALQRGFDIEASYTQQLADIVSDWNGSVTLRLLTNHIMHQSSTAADGTYTPGDQPIWRYSGSVTYNSDLFSVGWTGRGWNHFYLSPLYTQCTSGCPAAVAPYYTINENVIPGQFYMDLTFTYHLKQEGSFNSDFFFTVEDITNNHPSPIALLSGAETELGDPLGRMFRAGVRFKM